MGDMHLVDVIVCGGIVLTVIVILGTFCWSVDQHVQPHEIAHSGRSRRRACQRERIG